MSFDRISFIPGSTKSLAAGTSTGSVALHAEGRVLDIKNPSTTVTAYIELGDSNVEATTADYPILPGESVRIVREEGKQTHLAAITASGSVTLLAATVHGR